MQRLFRLGASLVGAGGGPPLQWEVEGRRLVEERPISEGGFAFVVQVRDLDTGEVFALKKIICQEKEAIETAKREASVLENLPSHKNIVGYYGHAVLDKGVNGCAHHQVLMLMELCTGGTLLDFLEGHKRIIPEGELMRAMTDIAEAIFCLHSHSPPLQHRDLKLENILRGSDGFWKIIDFGSWSDQPYDLSTASTKELAMLSDEITRNTTMMYRPPEMVDVYLRYPVSCAVDIWMLGCILFTLLYSRHPFQEASALAIREARYRLPQRSPEPSPMVIDLLVWLLAPDPRHRPSARKLVTMLWQWQDLPSLGLPQPVQEHRTKLLATWSSPGGPSAAAAGGGGQRRGEATRQPPSAASSAPRVPGGRAGVAASTGQGNDGGDSGAPGGAAAAAAAAAAAVAAADAAAAAASPWTASFGDFSSAGGAAASGSTEGEDFQGFQVASADPSPPLEEPAALATSGVLEAAVASTVAAAASTVAVAAADPSPPLLDSAAAASAAPVAAEQADPSPPADEAASAALQGSDAGSAAAAAAAASSMEVSDASPPLDESSAAASERVEMVSATRATEMASSAQLADPRVLPQEMAAVADESVTPAPAAEDTPGVGAVEQSPLEEEEPAPGGGEVLSAEPATEAESLQETPTASSSLEEPATATLSNMEEPSTAQAAEAPLVSDLADGQETEVLGAPAGDHGGAEAAGPGADEPVAEAARAGPQPASQDSAEAAE